MYATCVFIDFGSQADGVPPDQLGNTLGDDALNTDYQNIYQEFKNCIAANVIVNTVQELCKDNCLQELFYSQTQEQCQAFQQSQALKNFVQALEINGATVTVSQIDNIEFDNEIEFEQNWHDSVIISMIGDEYTMWMTSFPLVDNK